MPDEAEPPEIVEHINRAIGIAEAVRDEDYASGGVYEALVLSRMLANASLQIARAVAQLDQDQCDLSDLLDGQRMALREEIEELEHRVEELEALRSLESTV